MTFTLLHAGERSALFADAPVIKASDGDHLRDGIALLERIESLATATRVESETRRADARREGLAEGVAAVRAELAARLADLATDVARQQRERDEDLSQAAMAAVEAILGVSGAAAIGPALVTQALAGFVADELVQVTVAPSLAALLRGMPLGEQVRVVEDPALGELDCELQTARGAISAGLRVQLAALAERWSVAR